MATLTHDERARLAKAAEAARARTAARFELQIVPLSDRYALYPVAYGAFTALAVGGLLAAVRPLLALDDAFSIEAMVFVAVSLVLEWPVLKLMLVPRRMKHERARQFAHRAFAAHILAARERKSGMVLFASLGERYVELAADDALHQKIGQARWDAIVSDFTQAAKSGRLVDALEQAIQACGAELATHFPS
jgi:putative membrane protein